MPVLMANGLPATGEAKISDAEARTLRAYKKILAKYGYAESLWCATCQEEADHAGCRAKVADSQIVIECRHRRLYFLGGTY